MSNYIDGLATRALGISQTIRPRVPALFEPVRATPDYLDTKKAKDMPNDASMQSSSESKIGPLDTDFRPGMTSEKSLNNKSNFRLDNGQTQANDTIYEKQENMPVERAESPEHGNSDSSPDQATHFELHSKFAVANLEELDDIANEERSPDLRNIQTGAEGVGIDTGKSESAIKGISNFESGKGRARTSPDKVSIETIVQQSVRPSDNSPLIKNMPAEELDTLAHANPAVTNLESSDSEAFEPGKAIDMSSERLDDTAIEETSPNRARIQTMARGKGIEICKSESAPKVISCYENVETITDDDPNKALIETIVQQSERSQDNPSLIKNIPAEKPETPKQADLRILSYPAIHLGPASRPARFNPDARDSERIEIETVELADEIKEHKHAVNINELSHAAPPKLDHNRASSGLKSSDAMISGPDFNELAFLKRSKSGIDNYPDQFSAEIKKHSSMPSDESSTIKPPITQSLMNKKQQSNLPKFANATMSFWNDPSQASESKGSPVIKVTIGRIDVKAVLPPDKLSKRSPQRAKSSSLDEYLLSIRGGSR